MKGDYRQNSICHFDIQFDPIIQFYSAVSYSAVSYSAVSYSAVSYSAVSYSAVSYSAVSYSAVLYSAVLYSAVSYSAVSYSAVSYSAVSYSAVSYSAVSYSAVLYSAVLYSAVSYSAVSYSAVLYSAVLYSAVLYSAVSYSAVLYSAKSYSVVLLQFYMTYRILDLKLYKIAGSIYIKNMEEDFTVEVRNLLRRCVLSILHQLEQRSGESSSLENAQFRLEWLLGIVIRYHHSNIIQRAVVDLLSEALSIISNQ